MPEHQYSLLIGNGLSIAYNADLTVPALTSALSAEFQRAGGDDAGEALKRFALSAMGKDDKSNFEDLLGPLDHISSALVDLQALTPIAKHSSRIYDAIGTTADFLQALHQRGLATTLATIDARARDQDTRFDAVICSVCRAILDLSDNSVKIDDSPRPVTVGTLNYDGLLHAGFIELGGGAWGTYDSIFCDLAAGYGRTTSAPYGGRALDCLPIRSGQDLLPRKIHLINMHGFLGWLWSPATDERWKFKLEDLRGDPIVGIPSYWDVLAKGEAEMLPVVVLTDRKAPAVAAAPFVLAYGIFESRLFFADRWFIGGCALDDAPVRGALMRAAGGRVRNGKELRLLYVGAPGRTDYDEKRRFLSRELGIDESWITVNFDGFPDIVRSDDWKNWADA